MDIQQAEGTLKKFRLGKYALPQGVTPGSNPQAEHLYHMTQALRDASGGTPIVQALAQIPTYQQALVQQTIPTEKFAQVNAILAQLERREMNESQAASALRQLATTPVTSQLGQLSQNLQFPTSSRQEREARISAAGPRIQAWQDRTAQNSGVSLEKVKSVFKSFSDEQLAAVEASDQTRVIKSGGGGGKTDVVVAMITDAVVNRGMRAQDFTVLVATHSAEGELVRRLTDIGNTIPQMRLDWAGQVKTFHAKAMSTLNQRVMQASGQAMTPLQAMGMGNYTPFPSSSSSSRRAAPKNAEEAFRAQTQEEFKYFQNLLTHHGVRVQQAANLFQQIQAIKAEHGYDGQYKDMGIRGAQSWASGKRDAFESLLYMYEKGRMNDPQFKLPSQTGPHYDLADSIILAARAGERGKTQPWKNTVVDEMQDPTQQMYRLLAAQTRNAAGYRFFAGDEGQRTIKSGGSYQAGQAISQMFPSAKAFPLTGNYRLGPINTALYSATQMEHVLDNRGRAPFQVSMRQGGAEAFPTMYTATSFKQVNEQMFADYLKQQGLSHGHIESNIQAGLHPLTGAASAGSMPFVFQMKEQRRYFLKSIEHDLSQKFGPARAKAAVRQMFNLGTPQGTGGNQAHALLVNQTLGKSFPHVFADITRVGSKWSDADYAEQMGVVFSRPTEQLHAYSSQTNIAGSQYDLSPDMLHGKPVPPGMGRWYAWAIRNLVEVQGVNVNTLSWDDRALRISPPPSRASRKTQDLSSFQGFVEDAIKLIPHARPSAGAGIGTPAVHSATSVGVTSSSERYGDESTTVNGISDRGSFQRILGTAKPEPDKTRIDLIVGYARNLLQQGGEVTEDIESLMKSGMFGYLSGGEKKAANKQITDYVAETTSDDWSPYFNEKSRLMSGDHDRFSYRGADERKLRQGISDFLGSDIVRQHPQIKPLIEGAFTRESVRNVVADPKNAPNTYERQIFTQSPVLKTIQDYAYAQQSDEGQHLLQQVNAAHEQGGLDPFIRNLVNNPKDDLLREEILNKAADVVSFGYLPPEAIEAIKSAAEEFNYPALTKLIDAYGDTLYSADNSQIGLRQVDMDYIKANHPREHALLSAIAEKSGVDLSNLEDPAVQKQLSMLPHIVGQMTRAAGEKGQSLGIPIAESAFAPFTTEMAALSQNLSKTGILDPMAVQAHGVSGPDLLAMTALPLRKLSSQRVPDRVGQFSPFLAQNSLLGYTISPEEEQAMGLSFQSEGVGVGLEGYQKRLENLLSIQGQKLSPEQAHGYRSELEQVRSLRKTLGDPSFQLESGHLLNMVHRAATGESAIDKNVKGEHNQPYARFMAPLKNQFGEGNRTLGSIGELVSSLQEGTRHVQGTGTLSRTHTNRILEALGHDPSEFENLANLESLAGFGEGSSIPLTVLAGQFPSEQKNLLAQFTRFPFKEGQTAAFLGGMPGFTDIAPLGQEKAGLRAGMVGTLHPINKGISFGLPTDYGDFKKHGLFTGEEWKEHGPRAQNPEFLKQVAEPLAMLRTRGGKQFPVRLSQVSPLSARGLHPDTQEMLDWSSRRLHKGTIGQLRERRGKQNARVQGWLGTPSGQRYLARQAKQNEPAPVPLKPSRALQQRLSKLPHYTTNTSRSFVMQGGRKIPYRQFLQGGGATPALSPSLRAQIEGANETQAKIPVSNTPPPEAFMPEGFIGGSLGAASPHLELYRKIVKQRARLAEAEERFFSGDMSQKAYQYEVDALQKLEQQSKELTTSISQPSSPPPPEAASPFAQDPELLRQLEAQRKIFYAADSAYTQHPPRATRKEKDALLQVRNQEAQKFYAMQDQWKASPEGQLHKAEKGLRQLREGWRDNYGINVHGSPEEIQKQEALVASLKQQLAGGSPPPPEAPPVSPPPPSQESTPDAIERLHQTLLSHPGNQPYGGSITPDTMSPSPSQLEEPLPASQLEMLAKGLREGNSNWGIHPPSDEQKKYMLDPAQRTVLEGGPGTGKTDTAVRGLMHQVASGAILPKNVLGLSSIRSATSRLAGEFGRYRSLLPRGKEYDFMRPRTFASVASSTVLHLEHDPIEHKDYFPMLQKLGYKHLTGDILGDPTAEDLYGKDKDTQVKMMGMGQKAFIAEQVNSRLVAQGKRPWTEQQIKNAQKYIGETKKGRMSGYGAYERIAAGDTGVLQEPYTHDIRKGLQDLASGQMTHPAALVLHEQGLRGRGGMDWDDLFSIATEAYQKFGPDALPDIFKHIEGILIDEGQDATPLMASLQKGFIGALSANNPRVTVAMDVMQSLTQGMGGIPMEEIRGSYRDILGIPEGTPFHELTQNFRSDADVVAFHRALLASPHLQNIPQSPPQVSRSGNRGLPMQHIVTGTQPEEYRQMFRGMLGATGVSSKAMKENIKEGRHPLSGATLAPKEIAAIVPQNQHVRLFEHVAKQELQSSLGIQPHEASAVLSQIMRQGMPPADLDMESDEGKAAQMQMPLLKFMGSRGHEFQRVFTDASFTGLWQRRNDIEGYKRNLNVGLTRVSQGGQNVVGASEFPFTSNEVDKYIAGSLDLSKPEEMARLRKRSRKNAPEMYQGKTVPRFFRDLHQGAQGYLQQWNYAPTGAGSQKAPLPATQTLSFPAGKPVTTIESTHVPSSTGPLPDVLQQIDNLPPVPPESPLLDHPALAPYRKYLAPHAASLGSEEENRVRTELDRFAPRIRDFWETGNKQLSFQEHVQRHYDNTSVMANKMLDMAKQGPLSPTDASILLHMAGASHILKGMLSQSPQAAEPPPAVSKETLKLPAISKETLKLPALPRSRRTHGPPLFGRTVLAGQGADKLFPAVTPQQRAMWQQQSSQVPSKGIAEEELPSLREEPMGDLYWIKQARALIPLSQKVGMPRHLASFEQDLAKTWVASGRPESEKEAFLRGHIGSLGKQYQDLFTQFQGASLPEEKTRLASATGRIYAQYQRTRGLVGDIEFPRQFSSVSLPPLGTQMRSHLAFAEGHVSQGIQDEIRHRVQHGYASQIAEAWHGLSPEQQQKAGGAEGFLRQLRGTHQQEAATITRQMGPFPDQSKLAPEHMQAQSEWLLTRKGQVSLIDDMLKKGRIPTPAQVTLQVPPGGKVDMQVATGTQVNVNTPAGPSSSPSQQQPSPLGPLSNMAAPGSGGTPSSSSSSGRNNSGNGQRTALFGGPPPSPSTTTPATQAGPGGPPPGSPPPGGGGNGGGRGGYNNAASQFGRSMARLGYELQFMGKFFGDIVTQSLTQGSEYRLATSGLPGSGASATEGFYNFAKGPGISAYQSNTLPMYSNVQIAQGIQGMYASTGYRGGSAPLGTMTDIMGLAAITGMDPTQLMGNLAYLSGSSGQGQNMGSYSTSIGMLGNLFGNVLSPANVTPTLGALSSVVPTLNGISPGQGSQTGQAMAFFQLAQGAGMTPQNFGDVSSLLGSLSQVGTNPNLQQQYTLQKLGYPLTADTALTQFQQEQTSREMQIASLGLQQNINKGVPGINGGRPTGAPLSLPHLQIQIDQAQITMDKAELTMSGIQLASAQVSQQGAELQYQYGKASYNFNLAQQNALYGPIGKDYSQLAGYSFQQNQLVAGRNSTSPEIGTMFTPQNVSGLRNQEFYAGLQNQQQSLILGRSPLLSDALFQQQMKYIAQQADYYKQELALRNQQRQFDLVWQKRLLDQQGAQVAAQGRIVAYQGYIYSLQQSQFKLEQEKSVYDQKQAAIQQQFLARQEGDLEAINTALNQFLNGQGPVGGQNLQPQDLVQKMADELKSGALSPSSLQQVIRGLGLSPQDQGVMYQLVTQLSKQPETLAQMTKNMNNASDQQIVGLFNKLKDSGAFNIQVQTAGQQNAALQQGGVGPDWQTLTANTANIATAESTIAKVLAPGTPYLQDISAIANALGPLAVGVGTLANVIGLFLARGGGGFTGGGGGGIPGVPGVGNAPGGPGKAPGGPDYTNPATYGETPAPAAKPPPGVPGGGGIPFFMPYSNDVQKFPAYTASNLQQLQGFAGSAQVYTVKVNGKTYMTTDGGKSFTDTSQGDPLHALLNILGITHNQTTFTPGQLFPTGKTGGVPSPQQDNSNSGPPVTPDAQVAIYAKYAKAGGPGTVSTQQANTHLKNMQDYLHQIQQNTGNTDNKTTQANVIHASNNAKLVNLNNLHTQANMVQQRQALIQKNTDTTLSHSDGTSTSSLAQQVNLSVLGNAANQGAQRRELILKNSDANLDRIKQDEDAWAKLATFTKGTGGSTPVGHPGFTTPNVNAEFHQQMKYGIHQGVDFAAAQGTPIGAFNPGRVTNTGFYPWGGEVDVNIGHGLTERYIHLSQIGVMKGQPLLPRQRIGLTGGGTPASGLGYWSSGPHSHVQIDRGNILQGIDPWPLWAMMGSTNLTDFYQNGWGTTKGRGGTGGEGPRQLAEGGIAMKRVMAEIGEGKEPEAVLPLSRLSTLLKAASSSPGSQPGEGAQPARAIQVSKLADKFEIHVHTTSAKLDDQAIDDLGAQFFDILTTQLQKL